VRIDDPGGVRQRAAPVIDGSCKSEQRMRQIGPRTMIIQQGSEEYLECRKTLDLKAPYIAKLAVDQRCKSGVCCTDIAEQKTRPTMLLLDEDP